MTEMALDTEGDQMMGKRGGSGGVQKAKYDPGGLHGQYILSFSFAKSSSTLFLIMSISNIKARGVKQFLVLEWMSVQSKFKGARCLNRSRCSLHHLLLQYR